MQKEKLNRLARILYRTVYRYYEDPRHRKVIGEFLCNKTTRIARCGYDNRRIELNIVDENLTIKKLDEGFLSRCQLSYSDIEKYANGGDVYGWRISNLVIYDKPKELEAFTTFCDANKKRCANCKHYLFDNDDFNGYRRWCDVCHRKPLTRPPQSWCYIEEANNDTFSK